MAVVDVFGKYVVCFDTIFVLGIYKYNYKNYNNYVTINSLFSVICGLLVSQNFFK